MNYERIVDVVKEELSKESAIREEVIFKKGYAEGYKDAEEKASKAKEKEFEVTEDYAEGYADALQDSWEAIKYVIFEQSAEERKRLFGTQSIVKIVNEYSALDVMKILLLDAIEEDEKEKEKYEAIGEILDSELSDDAKKAILNFIDSFGDDIEEIKIVKLKEK